MPQTEPLLTHAEIERIADRLAVLLENDYEGIGLLTLLLAHLERIQFDRLNIDSVLQTTKRRLFAGSPDSEEAQDKFEEKLWRDRAELLKFPNEKGASA
ncbi:MAG TPA: hypothetical protein VIX17_00705 [Pyrinomonadaceae bacterium]|jgi:hypothetical protein